MRHHWKNTYGYRLPEYDSSPVFVGISFFSNNDFLYPLECVRRGMHMNENDSNVVVNFAKTVSVKAGVVCGNQLKLLNLNELQNGPKVSRSIKYKWSKSTLAELGSELLNKWLSTDDGAVNLTPSSSQDISLCTQPKLCKMSFSVENDKWKEEHDNWLKDCSQFIEGLAKGGQKRSVLKAVTFFESSASKSSVETNSLAPLVENSLSKTVHLKEGLASTSRLNVDTNSVVPLVNESLSIIAHQQGGRAIGEECYKIQTDLHKPCFNTIIKSTFLVEKNSQEHSVGYPFINNMVKNELGLGNRKYENEFTSISSFNSSGDICSYKPVFKKKCLYTPKGASKTAKMEKKKAEQISENNAKVISNKAMPILMKQMNEIKKKQKMHKKSIILNASIIEDLVVSNQLEKANVPSLCYYLKSKGISLSKDRKEVLMEKVKQLVTGEGGKEITP